MNGLLIEPDQLVFARNLFPDVTWSVVEFSEVDDCGGCPELDGPPAESVAVIVDNKWGFERRTTVCPACLHIELGYLLRATRTPPSLVEVQLLRAPVTYSIGVAA